MKNLLIGNGLCKTWFFLFKKIFNILFNITLYSLLNNLCLPEIHREKILKILFLNKKLSVDIYKHNIIFFNNYTDNLLSVFQLGINSYLNHYFFFNKLKKRNSSATEKYNNFIYYFSILYYIVYSLLITYNFYTYSNAPKTLFFNKIKQRLFYILVPLTLLSGISILLWLSKNISKNGITSIIYINILNKLQYHFKEYLLKIDKRYIIYINIILLISVSIFIVFCENIYQRITISNVEDRYKNLPIDTYINFKLYQTGKMALIFSNQVFRHIINFIAWLGFKYNINYIRLFFFNNGFIYMLLKSLIIVLYNLFYTFLNLNYINVLKNLNKYSVIIHGVRPGISTYMYLKRSIFYITILGSLYIISISLLSESLSKLSSLNSNFNLSSILIIYRTALQIFKDIRSYLLTVNYDVLLKKINFY